MYYIVYIEALNDYFIVNEWELCRGDEVISTYPDFNLAQKWFNIDVATDQNKYWKD